MKKTYFLVLVAFLALDSFGQNFSTKVGGHSYQLDIPDYFVKCYDLNDIASMQYKNLVKNTYLIVIEDNKEELDFVGMAFNSATEFLDFFIEDYYIEAKNRTVTEPTTFEKNNNSFSQVEFSFSDEDGDFFMLITAAETQTHFYKIMIWTLLENKDQYLNDFKRIASSLVD